MSTSCSRHARHGAAVDGDELQIYLRRVRGALPREGSRSAWAASRRRSSAGSPEADKKGLLILAVWENGDRQIHKRPIKARRPQGHEAPRAGRQVAAEMFRDTATLSPMKFSEALHRAADRSDGRPGEPVYADLLGEL